MHRASEVAPPIVTHPCENVLGDQNVPQLRLYYLQLGQAEVITEAR